MAQATTNRLDFRYVAQTTWDTVPSTPTFTSLRVTGVDIMHKKGTQTSNEFRTDRQLTDIIQVAANAEGGFSFELSASDFDPFFEALLATTLTTTANPGVNLQAVAASNKFVRASGSWISDGFVTGQWVKSASFTNGANNGYWHITGLTATDMTVEPTGVIVDEASTAGRSISGKYGRNGTTRKLFVIEENYADVSRFDSWLNMVGTTAELTANTGAIVTGKFNFMGKGVTPAGSTLSTGGGPTAAGTNLVFNSTSNVGAIYENSYSTALSSIIRSFKWNINNNARIVGGLTYLNPANINYGEFTVNGTIEAYFEDNTLYSHFVNHTQVSLSVRFTDSATPSHSYIFTFPAIKYSDAGKQRGAKNQEVTVPYNFQAFRDATTGCTMQIDIL